MPELTRAVGVPRLAGIGYPPGRPLGRPHDAEGQRAVLRATLEVLERATGPDHHVELPFEWPETVAQARNASRDIAPSPIAALLQREPWLLPRLYSGRIPTHPSIPLPPSAEAPLEHSSAPR